MPSLARTLRIGGWIALYIRKILKATTLYTSSVLQSGKAGGPEYTHVRKMSTETYTEKGENSKPKSPVLFFDEMMNEIAGID